MGLLLPCILIWWLCLNTYRFFITLILKKVWGWAAAAMGAAAALVRQCQKNFMQRRWICWSFWRCPGAVTWSNKKIIKTSLGNRLKIKTKEFGYKIKGIRGILGL